MEQLNAAVVWLRGLLAQPWLEGAQGLLARTPDWALLAAGPALLFVLLLVGLAVPRSRKSSAADLGAGGGVTALEPVPAAPLTEKRELEKLELFTSEIELLRMEISEEEFERLSQVGISSSEWEEILYELEDHTEFCSPIFDELTSLGVNGIVPDGLKAQMEAAYNRAVEAHNENVRPSADSAPGYAIIVDRWIKRAWYSLEITPPFDATRLDFLIENEGGRTTYRLTYDGVEFEFDNSHGANAESTYLITPDGDAWDVLIIEDEDEDPDEDDRPAAPPLGQS